ncbi:hypothetical protein NHX12_010549 [Muraenolepis orangiensis]|uniref:PH domain-containing protein n=1 Tax=Muraenolepis orangiensis TaxID=630683 RepID=A0A9Q0IAJ6_9TELE|nr:hypothetical protein NHX12_010549 [Muraenolepis orangiensis]
MGCCSVTQRNTAGIDEVGPDEIELLELSGDHLGLWNVGETRLQLSVKSGKNQPAPCGPSVLQEQQVSARHVGPQYSRNSRSVRAMWALSTPGTAGQCAPCGPSVLQEQQVSARHVGPQYSRNSRSVRAMWALSTPGTAGQCAPCGPSVLQEQQVVLWGRSRDELHHRLYSHQPIRDWEGQPAHTYGDIAHSSLVTLINDHTQERRELFLVLFSFHLLILSVDHPLRDFVYQGLLPLSGLTFRPVSLDSDSSHSLDGFEISSAMVDPKVFICHSAAEVGVWMDHLESTPRPLSPPHGPLSYLLPCDEHWKREELKKYLLQTPIRCWEGSPITRLGEPAFISVVHVMNTHRQGVQERLLVLYPQDVLLLSVDNNMINITYEGRLARHSVQAVERSAITGRLEFELKGELVEPLQISCMCLQDYHTWLFHLQQPERDGPEWGSRTGPPLLPKLPRSEKRPHHQVMAKAKPSMSPQWLPCRQQCA